LTRLDKTDAALIDLKPPEFTSRAVAFKAAAAALISSLNNPDWL
jgi:hypothetical protein